MIIEIAIKLTSNDTFMNFPLHMEFHASFSFFLRYIINILSDPAAEMIIFLSHRKTLKAMCDISA